MKYIQLLLQFLLLLIGLPAAATGQNISPQRLLEAAMSSMAKPMRYGVSADTGQGFAVSQIVDDQKQIYTKVELESAKQQMLYVFTPSGSYRLFPNTKTAIALDLLPQGTTFSKFSLFEGILPSTAILKSDETLDANRPFRLSVDLIQPAADSSVSQGSRPDRCEYLITRGSYLVTQLTMYRGTQRVSSLKLHGHTSITSPSLEEFQVPKSYAIKRPDSIGQFASLIQGQMVMANAPKRIPKGFALDPDTGQLVQVGPIEPPSQDLAAKSPTHAHLFIRAVFYIAIVFFTLLFFRHRIINRLFRRGT